MRRNRKELSSREKEIEVLVCAGLSNKAVAAELFIAVKTVKFHLTNIYVKRDVISRSQLIVKQLAPVIPLRNPNESSTTSRKTVEATDGFLLPVGRVSR